MSSLRVQELFHAVDFSSKPWYRDHWDEYGPIQSLEDKGFLNSTGMLQAVCRAATEFYARRFQDLPLSFEVDHAGGPPNFDFSSYTLMLTERPWKSNFIQITAVCSRKEGLMWIQVSYFKHWDGREPEARRREVPPSES